MKHAPRAGRSAGPSASHGQALAGRPRAKPGGIVMSAKKQSGGRSPIVVLQAIAPCVWWGAKPDIKI